MTVHHLHLVSDATGETINSVARACLVQFEGIEPVEHVWSLIRTKGQMDKALAGIAKDTGPVLFNSPGTPSFLRVSVPLVIGVSLATAGIFFVILTIALRAQRAPILTGQESFVGRSGSARTKIAPFGTVQMGGELWSGELAPGEDTILEGESVEVLEVKGVRVVVRKSDQSG